MSWFVAVLPKGPGFDPLHAKLLEERINQIAGPHHCLSVNSSDLILRAGGGPDDPTLKFGGDWGKRNAWFVSGLGFVYENSSFRELNEADWDRLLLGAASTVDVRKLDGHFTALTVKNGSVDVLCDQLGISVFNLAETTDYVAVSNRLDWIVSIIGNSSFCFSEMASGWELINSFSNGSFISGVTRSCPSSHVSILNGKVVHLWEPWRPGAPKGEDAVPILREAALLPLREGHKLSLGLSGGIDSRALLALLSEQPKSSWTVHSMGEINDLDIPVARRLSQVFGVLHRIEYYDLDASETVESIADSLREYALLTQMTDSIFGYQKLGLISKLNQDGFWMIDGAYGELSRRFNGSRLLIEAKKAVLKKDAYPLVRLLRRPKSAIFVPEITRAFQVESVKQLQEALNSMTEDPREDIGTWMDLFHIRNRLKNSAPFNQIMYDSYIRSYMPYLQPSVVSTYLSFPSKQRVNNKLSRQTIALSKVNLEKFSLVKWNTVFPYWTSRSMFVTRVWAKAHNEMLRYAGNRNESFRLKVLTYLKQFINDRVESRDVKASSFYDYPSITKHVESFYSMPNEKDATFIEDWLTFDFWREKLEEEAKVKGNPANPS